MIYYPRMMEPDIEFSLKSNPVTAIPGPRQCGKTTLAKHLIAHKDDVVFLDLERPSDLRKLDDPEWYKRSLFRSYTI